MLEGALRIEILDEDRVRVVGDRGQVRKRVIEGETGRLLAAGGAWERTVEQVEGRKKASNTRKAEELRAACERVDNWLRDFLKDGPAARDRVFEEAEAAGIPIYRSNNTRGASLLESRMRCGVLPLERVDDAAKTSFWRLPGFPFDEKAFRVYAGESARSRQMTGAMR